MRIPKIYLETTIFNFPFAEDAPQYKADTLKLFEEIKAGKFTPFTSSYVINELTKTKDTAKRELMTALVFDYGIEVLQPADGIGRLAEVYINSGIIPANYTDDAMHIAAATFYGMDCIISLNFKHIVKHKTIFETEFVNMREGFKRIFIHAPAEVINHD